MEFAERYCTQSARIDDGLLARLAEHFDPGEIVEFTLVIAKYMAFGRFMQVLGLDQTCTLRFDESGAVVTASLRWRPSVVGHDTGEAENALHVGPQHVSALIVTLGLALRAHVVTADFAPQQPLIAATLEPVARRYRHLTTEVAPPPGRGMKREYVVLPELVQSGRRQALEFVSDARDD